MDGRNSSGRKISLLNDSSEDVAAVRATNSSLKQQYLQQHQHQQPQRQLPSLATQHQQHYQRSPSCESTPSLPPQTPQLSRSSSSDSRGLASPSPLTPSLGTFEHNPRHASAHAQAHAHQALHQQQHYYFPPHHQAFAAKMDDQAVSMYPPVPENNVMNPIYTMPPQMPQHAMAPLVQPQPNQQQHPRQVMQRASTSPRSEPSHASNASGASNAKAAPKKNQYPCPMAKQVGCEDFFTTSGHAARHAKKHTGKKDAFCPECNKAFTRKDNMEQHRRTHQNGRGTTRTTDDNKVKKPAKQQPKKPASGKKESQLEAAVDQQFAEQQMQPLPMDTMQATRPQPEIPLQAPMAPQLQQPQQQQVSQQPPELAMMMPASSPYYINGMSGMTDSGPIPSLPLAPELNVRPSLSRSHFTNSLDYIPPAAPMMLSHPDDLHYSYPSPGLSNGLNSLALAASEHRRMSDEKTSSVSSRGSQGTP